MKGRFEHIKDSIVQENEVSLEQSGVHRIKFYHHKADLFQNAFTVCLLIDDQNRILSRGISICSLIDNFEKAKGRLISFGRAFAAIENESSSRKILFKNDDLRNQDIVQRTKEINSPDEFQDFKLLLLDNNLEYDSFVSESKKDKEARTLIKYYVPYTWNIYRASHFFNYKSEYKPEPKGIESSWLDCATWGE